MFSFFEELSYLIDNPLFKKNQQQKIYYKPLKSNTMHNLNYTTILTDIHLSALTNLPGISWEQSLTMFSQQKKQ